MCGHKESGAGNPGADNLEAGILGAGNLGVRIPVADSPVDSLADNPGRTADITVAGIPVEQAWAVDKRAEQVWPAEAAVQVSAERAGAGQADPGPVVSEPVEAAPAVSGPAVQAGRSALMEVQFRSSHRIFRCRRVLRN